ncbi:MAG: hypothetical protein J1F65_06055 [Clostridiales bacterium]|nr:hypothetical protein [Clostridiales bacterium]
MPTNELAYFTESVNTLIEGKLILIDKHIASVLKCVATSPTLRYTLSETVKTMSYATEFSRARVSWRRSDGVVESRLKLPLDRNRMFAFVVCLLTEVDSGRRNILEFLKEYYDDVSNDASYNRFAEEVLKPFKQAGEAILSTIDPESLNAQNVEQAERFFKAEKIYIDTLSLQQIFDEMEQVRRIKDGLQLSDEEIYEFNAASEYFVNALYLKNPRILSVSFLAYKNTVLRYDGTADHLQKIANLINNVLK